MNTQAKTLPVLCLKVGPESKSGLAVKLTVITRNTFDHASRGELETWVPKSLIVSQVVDEESDCTAVWLPDWKVNQLHREAPQYWGVLTESHLCTGRWCHCSV